MGVQLGIWKPGYMHRSDLREIDLTSPIYSKVGTEVNLSPHANAKQIARSYSRIGWYRDLIQGGKRCGHLAKKPGPEYRQHLTRALSDKLLEFCQWLSGGLVSTLAASRRL
jgi:hypothetical protein